MDIKTWLENLVLLLINNCWIWQQSFQGLWKLFCHKFHWFLICFFILCNEHGVAFIWYVEQCREKYHTEKASWLSAYVSRISVHNYGVYTYKKGVVLYYSSSYFIFFAFFILWLSLTHLRPLEKKNIFKSLKPLFHLVSYILDHIYFYQIHFKTLKWISKRVNLQITLLKIEAMYQLIK